MAKRFNMTIPKLPNVEQIDLNLLENKTSEVDIDKYFSKVELSSMSEYERTRYKNMKKNYELMISLGLPAVVPEFMKGPRSRSRKVKKEKHSDDSDEEWTPDLERRKSCRVQKQATYFSIPFKEKEKTKKIKKNSEVEQNKIESKNKEKFKKGRNENEKLEEKQKHDYPLRKLPNTNYMALEVPDDDEYLFCEDCNKEYKGACPVHGEFIIVTDSEIPELLKGTNEQAIFSLPKGMTVKESGIENAGLGVWAEQDIPVRTRFGPYKGKLIDDIDQAHSSGYAWQVYKNGNPSHFVDACEKSSSNWMRYVNCARTETEQNLAAFQYKGEIFYRAYKHISTGSELLVWYGQQYGQDLNIYRQNNWSVADWIQPKIINGEEIYPCRLCKGTAFSSLKYLYKHAKSKHGVGHIFQSLHHLQNKYSNLSKVVGCLLKNKRDDIEKLKEKLMINNHVNLFGCTFPGIDIEDENNSDTQFSDTTNKFDSNRNNINNIGSAVCTVCGIKISIDKSKNPIIESVSNMCKNCEKNNYKKHACGEFQNHVNQKNISKQHKESKPYKCDVCGKCFNRNSNLQKHYRTHTGSKPYKCDVCCKCFSDNSSLHAHYRTHTGSKPYKCDVCGKCFNRNSNLQTHYRTHTGSKPYKCDVCGKCFNRNSNLQTHYRTHTGSKPYKCDVCGKCFSLKQPLQTHYRTHTGSKPYKCDVCGKCFSQNVHLHAHYRTHTGSKPYKCDVCGKCFSQNVSLQKHYRTHTGSKPYKCDVCGKCFSLKQPLQTHYRTHTGSKPYKCDVCGKCFSQNVHLHAHYRTHTGSKPYKCDVCGKCFSQNGDLQKHYRTHTGSKPYKCDVCGKCFSQNVSLQKHYRTHTGSKPYKCDVCGKCFSQNVSLQKHYRTHTESKPYKCDVCGKCFSVNSNLQTHYRTHIGSKPYKCDVCGKCFSQNGDLQKHYRTHTGSKL